MITPDRARRLLLALTEKGPVRAAPSWLSASAFRRSDYVIVGDVVVTGYQRRDGWWLDEQEVRAAGERLASLPIDLGDLVDARIPAIERDGTWRSCIRRWFDEAVREHRNPKVCSGRGQRRGGGMGADRFRLGGGATWRDVEALAGQRGIASTRPLPLLSWSGSAWLVPRAYALLLDRAETLTSWSARADTCSECGGAWKWGDSAAPDPNRLCLACGAGIARPYGGHFKDPQNVSLLPLLQANVFLCQLCPEPRQAMYWDRCPRHGAALGVVCPSCAAHAGGGSRLIDRPGAVRHLLRCAGCRRERTLPSRHHPDIVARSSVFPPHNECGGQPRPLFATVERDGSVLFRLSCWQHAPVHRWEQAVPGAHVRHLVKEFVDDALAAGEAEAGRV